MKVILHWSSVNPEIKILIKALEAAGHKIVYWIGDAGGERYCHPDTIFHDHYEAWDGKPAARFAQRTFPPVDKALVESLFDVESITLTMMNKRYDRAPLDERKHIYYSMLSYWNGVLDELKPDIYIMSMLPHSIYNYMLYELAKRRGIRTILFDDIWFVGRLVMYRDIWNGNAEIKDALAHNMIKGITMADMGEEFRRYYRRQTENERVPVPTYMIEQRSIAEGWGLFTHRLQAAKKAIQRGNFLRLAVHFAERKLSGNLKKEYAAVVSQPDLSVPYVYFPLSFQPERTTSPQGGMYHDQILVAETIAAALPPGWRLYVKEHPSQWWRRTKERYSSARYRGYYRRLARIPHTRLVPVETDSALLLERSQAIGTVTGSAGWEALLKGKTPLVFGFVWYVDCPGVIRVGSADECRKAFMEIRNNPDRVTSQGVLAFLRALESHSIRAYMEDHSTNATVPRISPTESMRALATALCQELKKYTYGK